MAFTRMAIGVLVGTALLSCTTQAGIRTNRYARIIERNVFRLPPPPPPPPAPPLPQLTLTGLTTIVGSRALLKIQFPAHAPAPAKQEECILRVGESFGPVRLLEIDERAGQVKVDNSGTMMEIGFEPKVAAAASQGPRFHLAAH